MNTTIERNPIQANGLPVSVRRLLTLAVFAALLVGTACGLHPKAAARAFSASGERYMKRKKFSDAAIQFRNALQRDPADWRVRYRLSQAEGRLGDWPASYRDLNAVVAARPSFVPALLDLAEIDLMGERTDLAQRKIDQALHARPGDFRAKVLQVKVDLSAQKFEAARKQCRLLRSRRPKDASIEGMCALSDLGLRDFPAAETGFRKALALDPGSASETRDLASVLELEGHPKRAEALLAQSARRYPNSLDMQLILADFYVRHGRTPEAIALVSGLFGHKPAFAGLAAKVGDFWMDHNELALAVADYRIAEKKHPDALVERNLASAYLTLRQVPAAERYIRMILKTDPDSTSGRALEGAVDYMRGRYGRASRKLQKALKENPASFVAKYYLGMTYLATGQLDRAKEAFNDCIGMNDRFLQAYVKLGQIALEEGDWRLGAAYAQRVHHVNPSSIDAYLLLAQADMMHNDLAQAGHLITAAESTPVTPPAIHEVAARYDVIKKDFAAADKEFDSMLPDSAGTFPFTRSYVLQLAGAGQTARAIADLRHWMAHTQPRPAASVLLASLYVNAGKLDQGEAVARQLIARSPNTAAAYDVLGEIFERQDHPVEAAAEFSKSIRLDPGDLQGYLLAGHLAMVRGNYAQAQEKYQAALGEVPASDQAKLGLIRAMGARGVDLDRALGIAQTLKTRYPENAEVADAIGWIYHEKGFQSLALPQLEQAVKRLPNDATVQFHLGMTLMASRQKRRGRVLLARALKAGLPAPEQSAARRALGTAPVPVAESH